MAKAGCQQGGDPDSPLLTLWWRGWSQCTSQTKAEPVDRPQFLGQTQQVEGKVGLQQVQEAWHERREMEAAELPLVPQQAGTSQQGQQQQPEEEHGQSPEQRPWQGHL